MLRTDDLLFAARWIAKQDVRFPQFARYAYYGDEDDWRGELVPGASEPVRFARTIDALKRDIFGPILGDVAGQLTTIVQDSALLRALEGQSRVFGVNELRARELGRAALARAGDPTGYRPPTASFAEGRELFYTNRGTFLGVVELGRSLSTSLPPGNVEEGELAFANLEDANAWRLQPRVLPWTLAAPGERR